MSRFDFRRYVDPIGRGVTQQLRWRERANRMFDLELDAKMAQVRETLWIAKGRQRRHDLVNAFMAVEGASIILGRESLSASDRAKLMAVLDSGMTRLRAIIVSEAGSSADTVALAEVAASVAEETAQQGLRQVAVGPDLVATGLPYETTEAARQLLGYCRDRSPATPLGIRGVRDGDSVVLWIEDRGPELSEREQQSLLEPGRRWSTGTAPVTGLHIAIRLVQEQGGMVRLRPRIGGGMSFGIFLPAAVAVDSGSPLLAGT